MTTLELFRKHRKGEVSRDRFLYEVRRDSNLPWVTNTTSYDDAVKILKNKGIIREAQFEPQNIHTDPVVDRVNPYALKREVEKLLAKETELTNDSYKQALNKAAKKLTDPQAVKKAMFANADTVERADAKLQTQEVKKANHKDKHNEMKKVKGQIAPKATASSTKENRKGKPKGVEVMKDKGVEGTEKIIKEAALSELTSFLKKKLNLSEDVHYEYHVGSEVHLPGGGTGKIVEIVGGTCVIEMADGSHKDYQLNVLNHAKKESAEMQEPPKIEENRSFDTLEAAKAYAENESLKGYVQHVQDKGDHFVVDDWYDSDETVASYQSGMQLEEEMNEVEEGNPTQDIQPGDRIRVVYANQFKDITGTVKDVVNGFVVVTIDGKPGAYSMHISDVEKIEDEEMDEARDLNDPALVSSRARIQRYKDNPPMSLAQVLNQRDRDFEVEQEIKALKGQLRQTLIDMEQEAEPEGGPIADDYADRIMDLENQIKALEAQLREEDLEETIDNVTGVDPNTGERKTIGVYKAGQGRKIAQDLKSKGATTVQVNQIS
jgi:hypothetical protein